MSKTLSTPVKFALALPLILLLLAMALAAVVLGLAGSESGTRWLLGQAQRWSAGLVSWQSAEGSLMGRMRLEGVSVSQPGMQLDAQVLVLDWRPEALLQGTVAVDALEASQVRVSLSPTAPTEPAGRLLTPKELRPPVDIALQGVRLRDLELVEEGQPAVEVAAIDLDARLVQGELSLERLAVRLPEGGLSVTGSTTLDDDMPLSLNAAWDWRLTVPDNGDPAAPAGQIPLSGELALQGRLEWGDGIAIELEYRAQAEGLGGLSPELPAGVDLSGVARGRYLGEEVELGQLSLALDGTPLALALQGNLSQPGATRPSLDATLEWVGLQWPLTATGATVSSARGELRLSGSPDEYDVTIDADLAGVDLPQSTWQGSGSGDLTRIHLQRLDGRLLGGGLAITGPISWDPVPRWQLQVAGSELDPGELVPDLAGRLGFDLTTDGELDPTRGLSAELALEHASGSLLDYPFDLTARARLLDDAVTLERMALKSGGNRVSASGTVSPESLALDWQLAAPAPGALLPGVDGTLTGAGTVAGSPQSPRLQARLQGEALGLDQLAVTTVDAVLEAGLADDDVLTVEIETGPVRQADRDLIESLQLRVGGTLSRHRLDLAVAAGTDQLQAGLDGGLSADRSAWRGELSQLTARSEQYGDWRLLEPAGLSLSAARSSLGNSCLQGARDGSRLCAAADWSAAGESRIAATLKGMAVEQWVPSVTGAVDGELNATLDSGGALLADGAFRLTPGEVSVPLERGVKQLAHGGGDLALTVNAEGLAANLQFAAPEQGRVAAELQLPALTAIPLAEPQPLRGRIVAALPELDSLAAWIPELESAGGRLEADLALAGTLDQPGVRGELALSDGAADIPLAGLELRQINLRAVSDPAEPNQMVISGNMVSGPGRLEVDGRLDLPGNTLDLNLQGDRLLVYDTPDARALLSPDLQLGWSDNVLRLRGRLVVPEAAITPRLALSPAAAAGDPEATPAPGQAIAPSPDVIVIGREEEPAVEQLQAPFRIDSRVQLVLGDRVDVQAVGLISRLTGAVTFINTPEQTGLLPVADGRLSLEEGTFRAFGQNLDIETGQVIFANAPVTEPELNVRAVRWIDNDPQVTAAGVVLTGTPVEPSLTFVSNPTQMDASEVQSYLLTGRASGDNESVLSIGTYLSRRLYVGYGFNLLENTSEFNSLFSITPRYGLGANVGEADNNVSLTITYEH